MSESKRVMAAHLCNVQKKLMGIEFESLSLEHILPIIQNIASLVLLELIHMLKLLLVLLVQQELLRIMVICFVIKL